MRRFSGPTVHFVDEEFDTGPILAQRVVPVYPTDTPAQLAARVLKQVSCTYEAARCLGSPAWILGGAQPFATWRVRYLAAKSERKCASARGGGAGRRQANPKGGARVCVCVCVVVQEHQVYPEAVSALVDGRITWREDGIPILWHAN